MATVPATTGRIRPQVQLQFGRRRIHEDHRAEDQARGAADRQQAIARDLDFEDEQPHPEHDQQEAGVVDRQQLQARRRPAAAKAPPTTPGAIAPGDHSSTVSPSIPRLRSRYAMLGWAIALRMRCRSVISIAITSAPAVRRTVAEPSNRRTERPSSLRSRSERSGATRSMSGGDARQRLLLGEGAAVVHGLLGEVDVALAAARERPDVGGDVFRGLSRRHLVDLLAARRDRMSCADVRSRCHRRDIGRDRQDEACGGGTRAGRARRRPPPVSSPRACG